MNKSSLKYLNISFLIVVVAALTLRIYELKRTSFDIDVLNIRLTPFLKYLKPGSKIGFADSTQSPVSVMEVEYVMVPHIVVSSLSPDTLLLVRSETSKISLPGNYRLIEQRGYNDKVFSMMMRTK